MAMIQGGIWLGKTMNKPAYLDAIIDAAQDLINRISIS